jgi:hypothetical protein
MKKLISLMLILCMACMLIPAMADGGAAGVWYGDYFGAVMVLTLGEDGTSSMEVSGNQLASGTWAEKDGNIEITMTDMSGEASTQVATLADGVLTLADESMSVDFTQEPIESWAPAEVNPNAAAEDFEGEWTIAKVHMLGMMLDAASAGMGDLGIKIENSAISFTGSADSVTSFVGTDPLELSYENGALSFSMEIPNDAVPITFTMKAEMLQDGMMAVTIDMGYGATILYFARAAAEEPAA